MASDAILPTFARHTGATSTSSRWRGLSIAVKLPLGIALLLVLACGAVATTAYVQVRNLSFSVASERIALASTEIQELVGASMRTHRQVVQRLTTGPALTTYLRTHATSDEAAAKAALVSLVGGNTTSSRVALFDPDGHELLSVGSTGADDRSPLVATPLRGSVGTDVAMSPFERVGSTSTSYTVTAIVRVNGQVLGSLTERRRLSGSSQSMSVLNGLVGPEAELLIGNASGDLWTDFVTPVAAPPIDAAQPQTPVTYRGSKGGMLLVRAQAVPGTPWFVAVTLPLGPVYAPAYQFFLRALGITALIVLGGTLAGWLGSRRLTRPLQLVTEAAETVASDRPTPRLNLSRDDEIGRLALSFTTMAARVDESKSHLRALVDDLEVRVQARTAALEAANRELEAFSYSVSHDLRAPLRAIAGFVTILVEDHGASLSPDAVACVDVIAKRTRHMGQLIDDLLAFSRLGRQPITHDPIDMVALSRTAIDDVQRAEPARVVEFHVGDLPAAAGERSLVRQVIVNLIQNAMKFTRTRERATIDVGATATAGQTTYFVRDNGVGFDMQYADRLFGVFQRLHRAEEFEGTGVGLAIVQRIVERHGGRVWAEAVVDGGATFFFTLPVAPEEA